MDDAQTDSHDSSGHQSKQSDVVHRKRNEGSRAGHKEISLHPAYATGGGGLASWIETRQRLHLKKRVKGIAARNIVANERPRAAARLKEARKDLVRKAINGS
jgi:hypothetical protein